MSKKKVYLAHPISTTGEFNDSKRVAQRIRELGYEVYAPAENDKINDKSNNPTPRDIFEGDIYRLEESDIMVVNLTGSLQDGTISEVGFVAGHNRAGGKPIKIVGYSSSARLNKPQHYKGIPSAGANHLVLGMIEANGVFVDNGSEEAMIKELGGSL